MPKSSTAWLGASPGSTAEPVEVDDAYYVRNANAEDESLQFDRPRETAGFNCGSYGVAGADCGRNQHLDFVTANYRSRSMRIYAGNGDGTFTGKGTLPGELRLRDGKWALYSAVRTSLK